MEKYKLSAVDIQAILFAMGMEFLDAGKVPEEDSKVVTEPMALIAKRMISHLDGTNPLDENNIKIYMALHKAYGRK